MWSWSLVQVLSFVFRPRRLGGLLLSIPAEALASLRVFSTNRLERTNTQSWRTARATCSWYDSFGAQEMIRPRASSSPRPIDARRSRADTPDAASRPRRERSPDAGRVRTKKSLTRPVEVDDSPLASRRILDAPDGCKPPSGLPVHSRVRLLLVSLVGGVGESRLAVVQRAPARGYGWSVSRKSVDRVGARVARRGARV